MQLQRILAADARAAKEQALARFGPDVLIVSTARVGDRTELIVAVDLTETAPRPPAPAPQAAARFQSLLMAQPGAASAVPAPAMLTPAMPAWARATAPSDVRWPSLEPLQATTATTAITTGGAERHGAPGIEGRDAGDALQAWRAAVRVASPGADGTTASVPDWALGTQAMVGSLRDELAALRREVRRSHGSAAQAGASRWTASLGEAGVPPALRPPLAGALAALHDATATEPDDAALVAALRGALQPRLPAPAALPLAPGLHLLVGPPGAGKTLMAARWARRAVERLGADRVTLVGWYGARPGAWGPLQLLGARLGVDTLRATDAATLALLLDDLPADRLVLVDTSAPLLRGADAPSSALAAGAAPLGTACWHLVLPADASRTVVQRWAPPPQAGWSGLWISRVDTGLEPWPLLQLVCEAGLPVIAASQGDDLDALDPGFDAAALLQHAAHALAAELGGREPCAPPLAAPAPAEALARPAQPADAVAAAAPIAPSLAPEPPTPRRRVARVAPQAHVEIPQFVPSTLPAGGRALPHAVATPDPTLADTDTDTAIATLSTALQSAAGAALPPSADGSAADGPAAPPAPRRPRMNAAAQRAAAAAALFPAMPTVAAWPAATPRAAERRATALFDAGAADISVDRATDGASLRARSSAPTLSKATHA
jgi:flagellar biosynthesis protein FlhF